MESIENQEKQVLRNLRDAGCPPKTIQQFLLWERDGQTSQQVALLKKHRCLLLNKIHALHNELDCLDFLLRQLEKSLKETCPPCEPSSGPLPPSFQTKGKIKP